MANYSPICIIIPAYNEEKSILSVISAIKKLEKKFQIVVVNDGSTDNTKGVLENHGIDVLDLRSNLGYVGAIQAGLKFAKKNKFNIVVQMDADGQHNPKYIPKLLDNLKGADMVLGSRYIKPTKYKTPFVRLIVIKAFSQLIYWIYKVRIHDPNSGYQVFGKKVIDFFTNNHIQDFAEPPRVIALLLKNGYKIREVSVVMKRRIYGKSHITWPYGVYLMIANSISIILDSVKK